MIFLNNKVAHFRIPIEVRVTSKALWERKGPSKGRDVEYRGIKEGRGIIQQEGLCHLGATEPGRGRSVENNN